MARYLDCVRASVATAFTLWATPGLSANPEFQEFFFLACSGATDLLAQRCNETQDGLGNISGDSESSLNPSHGLSHNQAALAASVARSKESRERGASLRDGEHESPAAQVAIGPWSVLAHVRAASLERSRDAAADAERGFDGDSWAFELGVDRALSERVLIGGLVGFERTQYDFDAEGAGVNFTPAGNAGDARSDGYYLTLFSVFHLGERSYVETSGGIGRDDRRYRRNAVFQESGRQVPQTDVRVQGDTDANLRWAGISAGTDFAIGALGTGLYGGIAWSRASVDAYAETDLSSSGLAMNFESSSRNSLLGHAGVRGAYVIGTAAAVLLPQLRVEYQHEFRDDVQTLAGRLALDASDTAYRMQGDSIDRSSIVVGAGVSALFPGGLTLFFDFEHLLGQSDFDRSRLTLGLRREF